MGLGSAAVFARLRAQREELELRVQERTEELRRANEELSRLAFLDALTGVANRRVFDDALAAETARATRYGGTLSVVMADLDHFKGVNDTHGHAAGDEVLRVFGSVLRSCARESDVVARYGGEEFAILAPNTGAAAAAQYAERVRRLLAERVIPPLAAPMTCSFGVAEWRPGGDARDLVARADAALYAAKREGRNRVVSDGLPVGV
jgi:diguanylate cyclase (GGDEF)-like protein